MKYFLFTAFTLLNCWLAASDSFKLSEFDGSQPVRGLFDEQVNPDFFFQNLTEVYKESSHYQGLVHPFEDKPGAPIFAWFENESDSENAIVVSSVDQRYDTVQNYLIKIPAWSELKVEITDLLGSDDVYFLSMLPFRVYWDTPFVQEGKRVDSLRVSAPQESVEKSASLVNHCGYWDNQHDCKVTNANGPGIGGSAVGFFVTSHDDLSTVSLLYLDVFYPLKTTIYHISSLDVRCPNFVPAPPDFFKTIAWYTSGRLIEWTGVGAVLNGTSSVGTAACIDSALPEEYPCLVDTDGDGTLDSTALWTVELHN